MNRGQTGRRRPAGVAMRRPSLVSNPVFENSPHFGEKRGAQRTTPNGYPTHPGYSPGGATGTMTPPAVGQQQVHDLEYAYQQPAAGPAQTGRMTYDDVIIKTGGLLALVVGAAAVSWFVFGANMIVTFGAMVVGRVLGQLTAAAPTTRASSPPV